MYTAAFLHTVFFKSHIRESMGSVISGAALKEARVWLKARTNVNGTIRWKERW